jgi:hypothetical protein
MKKTICILLTLISVLYISCSCSNSVYDDTATTDITDTATSEPHDPAFTGSKGSSYLMQMDDLKVINLAANFLKGLGETVTFQETYIEYHEAQDTAVNISLADGESIDYSGAYLEIRFYDIDDLADENPDNYTVVYISQDGKVLGQNKLND